MQSRNLKESSARPSQPQAEGRADDASSLTSKYGRSFRLSFRGAGHWDSLES
jgi:hypothetical protein